MWSSSIEGFSHSVLRERTTEVVVASREALASVELAVDQE